MSYIQNSMSGSKYTLSFCILTETLLTTPTLSSNDLLDRRSRTSTPQQRAFASTGPLLWNRLPAQIHAQILSRSSSSAHLLEPVLYFLPLPLPLLPSATYKN